MARLLIPCYSVACSARASRQIRKHFVLRFNVGVFRVNIKQVPAVRASRTIADAFGWNYRAVAVRSGVGSGGPDATARYTTHYDQRIDAGRGQKRNDRGCKESGRRSLDPHRLVRQWSDSFVDLAPMAFFF